MSESDIMRATVKLSQLQRRILCWLLDMTERIETDGNDFDQNTLKHWGVKWNPRREKRSHSVILSRSLRRLETRDLVARTNDWGTGTHHRTTHAKLTELGREVANKLRNG